VPIKQTHQDFGLVSMTLSMQLLDIKSLQMVVSYILKTTQEKKHI
ncbi:hypothetical protein TVAGG3_0402740, partial [Trichomonas vaginalis G3]